MIDFLFQEMYSVTSSKIGGRICVCFISSFINTTRNGKHQVHQAFRLQQKWLSLQFKKKQSNCFFICYVFFARQRDLCVIYTRRIYLFMFFLQNTQQSEAVPSINARAKKVLVHKKIVHFLQPRLEEGIKCFVRHFNVFTCQFVVVCSHRIQDSDTNYSNIQ